MKSVKIISHVYNGNLSRNRQLIKRAIASFEGKEIEITISRKKKTRSTNQNAYYWGVIIELVRGALNEATGEFYSKDEVHEFLKGRFNFIEIVNEDTGEIINVPKSTTDNLTIEQEEYHEKIRRFCLEWFNLVIPLPNEQLEIEI